MKTLSQNLLNHVRLTGKPQLLAILVLTVCPCEPFFGADLHPEQPRTPEESAAISYERYELLLDMDEEQRRVYLFVQDGHVDRGLITGERSGRFYALDNRWGDDFRQLIFTLEPSPGLRGGHDELEDHQFGGLARQRAFGPHRSMADCCKHALDRVGRSQMVPSKARRPLIRSMKRAQPAGCEGGSAGKP